MNARYEKKKKRLEEAIANGEHWECRVCREIKSADCFCCGQGYICKDCRRQKLEEYRKRKQAETASYFASHDFTESEDFRLEDASEQVDVEHFFNAFELRYKEFEGKEEFSDAIATTLQKIIDKATKLKERYTNEHHKE